MGVKNFELERHGYVRGTERPLKFGLMSDPLVGRGGKMSCGCASWHQAAMESGYGIWGKNVGMHTWYASGVLIGVL